MADFINKTISIILVFAMLVLAPILLSYMSTDMATERIVLNQVDQFIDKVTDKKEITPDDLDELYLAVNSQGGIFDVSVDRYIRVAYQEMEGGTPVVKTTYFRDNTDIDALYDVAGNVANLNVTDVVKVTVEETNRSPAKRLMWSILRIDKGKFEFSLAGTVR
jgi:hypothetical protein